MAEESMQTNNSAMEKLMVPIVKPEATPPQRKVTVVGVGQVGMAGAFSIMLQNVCGELCLVDVVQDKLRGEMLDLQHGQQFIPRCKVTASTDYAITADSSVVVVTAGARQREGESRLNLVQRNVDIFKFIIPQVMKYSPNCILVIVSNPVDILTHVAWKLSGLPKHKVIGSGTMLDSARFRFLIGEKMGIHPSSCHGYIIGEHGDSSVAVWSSVNVANVPLRSVYPDIGTDRDTEGFGTIHRDVIESAYEIIRLKGYTSWAIGVTISNLVSSIIRDQRNIHPVSTVARGFHGIPHDVFLSLPCVISSQGITHVIPLNLTDAEKECLNKSSKVMWDVISGIKW
jgi:L-lactate dehydrogenase